MRFLLVEPNHKTAKAIQRLCNDMLYDVDYFTDAGTALTRVENRANDYDLLLVNADIKEMTVAEWCREVRSCGTDVPIIALIRADDLETVVELLGTSVDDCIRLPVRSAELIARTAAVLRRPRGIRSDTLEVGPLRIDFLMRRVFHNEQEVMLSKKEFMIVEYLAHRLEQVVDRNDLLGHVWDVPEAVMANTLNAHVKNVRRKLSLPNGCDIETIRGIGYRMSTRNFIKNSSKAGMKASRSR